MSDVEFNGCSPASKGMPQLDLREVFAAAEDEKILPAPTQLTVLPDLVARKPPPIHSRFGHSEWANITFVTIAVAGALFSAFYFFNGADVLRAAGRWSGEFLYPQPPSTATNMTPPVADTTVSTASSDTSSQSNEGSNGSRPFSRDYLSGNLPRPSTFGAAGGIGLSGSATGGVAGGSALGQLSTLARGADNLFQSLYQTVPATSPAKNATASVGRSVARKTISGARNLVLQRTQLEAKSLSNSPSGASGLQQTTNTGQAARPSLGFNPGFSAGRGATGGGGAIGGAVGGLSLGGRAGR